MTKTKSATISEHVSAAIGTRYYVWAVAAVAGVLVFASILGSSNYTSRKAAAAVGDITISPRRPIKRSQIILHSNLVAKKQLALRNDLAHMSSSGGEDTTDDGSEDVLIRKPDAAGCKSTVCRWQGEYVRGKLDETVDPCKNFYEYVCSSAWFADNNEALGSQPYLTFTSGKLMYDLETLFHDYRQGSQVEQHDRNDTVAFMARTTSFFLRCIAKEMNTGKWHDLINLLQNYELEGFPYESHVVDKPDLANVVGRLDRDLGLNLFFRVSLTMARRRRTGKDTVIFFDRLTSTPSMRYVNALRKRDLNNFMHRISLALSVIKGHKLNRKDQIRQVVQVDNDLTEVVGRMEARKNSPSTEDTLSVEELSKHSTPRWNWKTYAQALIGESLETTSLSNVRIQLQDEKFFKELSHVLEKHSKQALLNYLGFVLIAFISPLLPHSSHAKALYPLSHDEHIDRVPHLLQACVHVLARTYRYGARDLARRVVVRETPDVTNLRYENEMQALTSTSRDLLVKLFRGGTQWMSPTEVWTALQRIDTLKLVFLEEPDGPQKVASYYRKAVQAASLLKRSQKSTLLEEYLAQQNETRRLYWQLNADPERNLEARWPELTVIPTWNYFEARNILLLSPGLLGFLNTVSATFDPLVIPIIGPYVLGGLMSIIKSSLLDVPSKKEKRSQKVIEKRGEIFKCLLGQYGAITKRNDTDVPEEVFLDSAVTEPLLQVYKAYLEKSHSVSKDMNIPELPGKGVMELFFINYAVGQCRKPGLTITGAALFKGVSPEVKVNIPLMNSKTFSSVFHCKSDDPMNPPEKCKIW
ncbi:uncharacterized protein LOC135401748 [Ornithodoros turicata]|uniref:uncharacterized protein LOC135401748 n=1 Tax=Ornithodoros turicata TaxID=34597 RepID=UPI0031386D62